MKKQEIKEKAKPDKIKIVPLVLGILVIIAAFAFLIFYPSESKPWAAFAVLVLFGIMLISMFIMKRGKPKEMSSDTWIYLGIFTFMLGSFIEDIEILKMLGFVYFIAGLSKKALEKKGMSDVHKKKIIFWAVLALLISLIAGVIAMALLR